MARISTIYDNVKGKNQKVFMVRGDEGYAKTTKTVIEYNGGIRRHIASYDIQVVVDVLRDTDDSSITFFDGEESMQVTNWTSSSQSQTIWLNGLTYDIQHEITAVYNGNSSCLKSRSNVVSVNEENTLAYETALTSSSEDAVFESNQDVILNFNLADISGHSSSVQGMTISVYVDDTLIESSATTDASGDVSINCGRLTVGKKDIYASFDGYVNTSPEYVLSASEVRFGISVGKIVTLESYPQMFVNGQDNQVVVSVKDYWKNPIENASVTFADATGLTDDDGMVTLTPTSMMNGQLYYATCGVYTSNTIVANVITINNISIQPANNVTGPTYDDTIYIKLEGSNVKQPNIPITVSGGINGTYYTNNAGAITPTYTGMGVGDVTISASCLNLSSSVTIEDVMQYWFTRSTFTVQSYIQPKFTKQDGGWLLQGDYGYTYLVLDGVAPSYTIEFTVVADNTTKFSFGEMSFRLNFDDPAKHGATMLSLSHTKYAKGTKIKIYKVNRTTVRYYVNGKLVKEVVDADAVVEPSQVFLRFSNNSEAIFKFNHLKMKKIN